jgi:hypothetical protein
VGALTSTTTVFVDHRCLKNLHKNFAAPILGTNFRESSVLQVAAIKNSFSLAHPLRKIGLTTGKYLVFRRVAKRAA